MNEPDDFLKASRTRILNMTGVTVAFIVAAALGWRLRFGIDVTDESHYMAVAYRFFLGDRPFIDELNPAQMAGILLLPFLKIFSWITGDTDGLVLFSRRLYFVFCCFHAATIFIWSKRFIPLGTAVLLSALAVSFIPFCIPNVSYNTLGFGLFSMALFLGAITLTRPSGFFPFASGLCMALALFVYPSYLVPAILFMVLLLSLTPLGFLRTIGYVALGCGLVSAALLPFLHRAGWNNLMIMKSFLLSFGVYGKGPEKIAEVWQTWLTHAPSPILLSSLLISSRLTTRKPLLFTILFSCLVVLLAHTDFTGIKASLGLVLYLGLTTPIFFSFFKDEPVLRRSTWLITAPALIAGLATSWSSANGGMSAALGLFPSAVICVFLAVWRIASEKEVQPGRMILALILVGSVHTSLVFHMRNVYRDDPIRVLKARVKKGPFRGLYTTPEKRAFLDRLSADIASIERSGGRILVFNNFPAGFLLSTLPPAICSTWITSNAASRIYYLNSFRRNLNEQTLSLRMKSTLITRRFFDRPWYGPADPLFREVVDHQKKVLSREEYDLFLGLKEQPLANR